MSFTILDLNTYLQHYSSESILSALSSFESREGSEDLCLFLQKRCDEGGIPLDNFIDFERKHLCRIYFVLSDQIENTGEKCVLNLKDETRHVLGYFSVSAKTLYSTNISEDQKLLPKKNIVTYLIGHLCKNTSYDWSGGGEFMLQQCFEIIESVHLKIGIEFILIECSADLIEYYSKQQFIKIGFNPKNSLYQMIRKIEIIKEN